MTHEHPIDFLRLAINLGGKKDSIREMLELFVTSTRELLAQLDVAISANDISRGHMVLHKLKGSAQNLSANRFAALCKEAEESPTLGARRDEINAEFLAIEAAISEHLARL